MTKRSFCSPYLQYILLVLLLVWESTPTRVSKRSEQYARTTEASSDVSPIALRSTLPERRRELLQSLGTSDTAHYGRNDSSLDMLSSDTTADDYIELTKSGSNSPNKSARVTDLTGSLPGSSTVRIGAEGKVRASTPPPLTPSLRPGSQTVPPFANETNDHFSKGVSTFTGDKAGTTINSTAPPFANKTNDHFSKGVSTFTGDKAGTPINSTHLPRPVEVNGSSDAEPTPGFMIHNTTPPPPAWFVPVEAVPAADPQPLPGVHATMNPIITITEHAPKSPFDAPSPFERVASIFPDFDYQVVALHTELCGTHCMFPYPGARTMEARGCSPCFCDHLCLIYDDCCPDVQLLDTITLELLTFPLTRQEMKAMTEDRDLYTCEISHMKPAKSEKDYDNFFSMVNYCPRTNSSNGSVQIPAQVTDSSQGTNGKSTAEEETAESLELKCENRGMSDHWDYHRPLTSGHGVVYRNKFCAKCHGEHAENLTDWNTAVTCDADLLYSVTSAAEAYFLALNTTDCDVRFTATTAENLRRCKYVNESVISSCNQTGLWRNYDAKIERACASFTSVVKRKYKNAFCYLCNTDVGFEGAHRDLNEGSDEANVGRASFYALLDLGAQDGSSNSARVEKSTPNPSNERRRQCEIGTTLDPLVCQCRKLSCAPGFRSEGDNCTQVFVNTNYFGFKVCSRFQLTSPMPIAFIGRITSSMNYINLPGMIYLNKAESFPRLGCQDNSTLTVDVIMEIYSTQAMLLREMADSIIRTLKDHASSWANWNSGNLTVVTPAPDCLDYSDWISVIPDSCSTKSESMSVKLAVYYGPREAGVKNQMSFSTLRNTTFCPRVNLTQGEFSSYMARLARLDLDESNITFDVTHEGQATFYLLCVEDFHKILLPDTCVSTPALPGTTSTRVDFEDTWTFLGVVSIVCTCVSLVSLLCVVVTYLALPPLREGTGLSTLAMTCLLFLAQAMHEFGLEQYEIHQLCLVLALLIHFFWLSAVFMMSSCTLQLFLSTMFPLRARLTLASRKLLGVSLVSSFSLSAAVIGATVLSNQLIHGDPGYPARYLCFIDRSLSRQLGFGLPLGLAVTLNVALFTVTVVHIRRRPHLSSTRQNHVSLVACFRLSVITGGCWLSLFLLAVPGTRPWLEYVAVVLLGLQGLLLATTLLLNKRVYNLWRKLCGCSKNHAAALQVSSQQSSGQNGRSTLLVQHSSCQSATTGLSSNNSSIKFDSSNKESLKTEKNSHPSDSDTQTCRL